MNNKNTHDKQALIQRKYTIPNGSENQNNTISLLFLWKYVDQVLHTVHNMSCLELSI